MSRIEADKEDLIADATALVERAEYCRMDDCVETSVWKICTVGFRANGSLSLYFDQDPFYQFDEDGLLRRAYEAGFLYRTQTGTLARLDRQRSNSATTLQRADLTSSDLQEFRRRMLSCVTELHQLLRSGNYQRPRHVSKRGDIDERTISALAVILQHGENFLAEQIGKRK